MNFRIRKIDFRQNRKDMPTANFDSWTPLEDVAKILHQWSDNKDKPHNGSLIQVKTHNKVTTFDAVAAVSKA